MSMSGGGDVNRLPGGDVNRLPDVSGVPAGQIPANRIRGVLPGGVGVNQPPPEDGRGATIQEAIQDAQTRPLDFPATERAGYIRAMIKRAAEYKTAGRSIDEIRELLPEFVRDYPHLFETVTQPGGYDESNMNTMLAMLERMGSGQLNQHQATVIVGQRLASKYLQRGNGNSR